MARQLKRSTVLSIAIVFAAMCLTARPARAAAVIVNSLNDINDAACNAAHCSLREAVTYANANDTISFTVTGTITLTGGQLTINKNLTIQGPGAGALAVSGNNADQVFNVTCCTVDISGLTIQNGADVNGGGIYNSGSLAVSNSTFSGNSAIGGGAILNDFGGVMTVTNSTFSGNSAATGGAIENNAAMTVTNSSFSGNSATNTGGGINSAAGTLSVTNSTFSGNTAATDGGGLVNTATLTVTNSTFSGNSATINGGGIENSAAMTVTGSLITGNSANSGGALYSTIGGSVSASCIEANNSSIETDVHTPDFSLNVDGNWWNDPLGPNQSGETTGVFVATFLTSAPPCGATSASAASPDPCLDDRINCHHGDWLAVLYGSEDDLGHAAINIYCVDLAGKGYFGMQVTQADIDAFPAQPAANTLVKETDNCRVPVRFYILTTGEYQINIGPDYEGKVEVIIFTGLPADGVYFERFTEDQ